MLLPILDNVNTSCLPPTQPGGNNKDVTQSVFKIQGPLVHKTDNGPVIVLADYSMWCVLHCGFVQKNDLVFAGTNPITGIF